MTFKIKLVKELEQNKSASNVDMDCFIHPYREYIVEYLTGEKYKLIIDDKLVGNRGGSYKIKLIKKDEGITVYSYVYNAKRRIPEVFEYKNPKYDDIIEALEEAGYIKKI
ncbi:MAG: hypothetical protein HG454_000235 [Clostridiales bacterium]|jgi:hypothetical protein|nr:hypothetical protein [Clostridiales bacterium]